MTEIPEHLRKRAEEAKAKAAAKAAEGAAPAEAAPAAAASASDADSKDWTVLKRANASWQTSTPWACWSRPRNTS